MSASSQPAQLFRLAYILLHCGTFKDPGENLAIQCDQFAVYFVDKIDQIHADLDSRLGVPNSIWSCFVDRGILPEDVDRIFGGVWPTTSILESCRSWLVKEAGGDRQDWICPVVSASLEVGHISIPLKEAIICLLEKQNRDQRDLAHFRPVS